MAEGRLILGDTLPTITLSLTDGRRMTLPDEIPGRYLALFFYRGVWCGMCRKHLASYQPRIAELKSLGADVVVASVNTREAVIKMTEENGLGAIPMAYGVTDEDVAAFHPLFVDEPERGHYIEPMELLVAQDGIIFGSMYTSGSVGRMGVEEVLDSLRRREGRRIDLESAQVAGVGA